MKKQLIISLIIILLICICFIGCTGKNHIVLNFSINKPQEFNLFGWNIKIYPNIVKLRFSCSYKITLISK